MKSSNEGQLSQCDQALVAPAPAGCPKRWRLASSCGRAEERDWINICKAVGLLQLARTRHVSSATCATAQLMPRQGEQSAAPHPAAHRMFSTVAASVRDSSRGRLPIWELTAATQSLCMGCMGRAEGTCLVREVLDGGENRAFCFCRQHHEHPTPGRSSSSCARAATHLQRWHHFQQHRAQEERKLDGADCAQLHPHKDLSVPAGVGCWVGNRLVGNSDALLT